jgi:hypothetical protein
VRLQNIDFLVAKTNDGRLDLREIMVGRCSLTQGWTQVDSI